MQRMKRRRLLRRKKNRLIETFKLIIFGFFNSWGADKKANEAKLLELQSKLDEALKSKEKLENEYQIQLQGKSNELQEKVTAIENE